jgi:hypothetical protein
MEIEITSVFNSYLLYLYVDFLSGLIHWFGDTYLDYIPSYIKEILQSNSPDHHKYPTHFVSMSIYQFIFSSLVGSIVLFPFMFFINIKTRLIYALCAAIIIEITHHYNHVPINKYPTLFKYLSLLKIIQSRRHHHDHHLSPYINYCVFSSHVNFILDNLHFWRWLELLIFYITGYPPIIYPNISYQRQKWSTSNSKLILGLDPYKRIKA